MRMAQFARRGWFAGGWPDKLPIDRGSAIGVCVLDGHMIHVPNLDARSSSTRASANLA